MADSESDGGGEPNVMEENPYIPDLRTTPSIPHYYGDYVRQLFMIASAMMLIFSPFLTMTLPGALPFEIGGAIAIAILGALTNPLKQISMLANSIASIAGIITYELLAINAFYEGHILAFIEREALALIFLFALYFSLKTFRNMVLHLIGKKGSIGQFIHGDN